MAKRTAHSFNVSTATGQRRLMEESVGMISSQDMAREGAQIAASRPTQDYGADPIGDGTFRMVPSGDIVDWAERCRRLPAPKMR